MSGRFDPCHQGTGSVSSIRPTMRPGRQDRGEEGRVFQPSVLETEKVSLRDGGGNDHQEGDMIGVVA